MGVHCFSGSGFSLKGAAIGAISGAIFSGVGDVFQGKGFFTEGGLGHIATHSVVGGVMSAIQGGKFGHGFISAGLTKAASPLFENISTMSSRVAVAALIGGTVSKLTGGKFANGALTAAFSRRYNEEAHKKKGAPITAEQAELAKNGKFKEFWESRHDAGDPVAKTALTGWGNPDYVDASLLEKTAAAYTWSSLEGYIKDNNLDVTMEQIGQELAIAHTNMVAGDRRNITNLLSPQQVADYHHNVFKRHGIPKYIFGGTQTIFVYPKPGVKIPLIKFKANDYSNMWCKGCDK